MKKTAMWFICVALVAAAQTAFAGSDGGCYTCHYGDDNTAACEANSPWFEDRPYSTGMFDFAPGFQSCSVSNVEVGPPFCFAHGDQCWWCAAGCPTSSREYAALDDDFRADRFREWFILAKLMTQTEADDFVAALDSSNTPAGAAKRLAAHRSKFRQFTGVTPPSADAFPIMPLPHEHGRDLPAQIIRALAHTM